MKEGKNEGWEGKKAKVVAYFLRGPSWNFTIFCERGIQIRIMSGRWVKSFLFLDSILPVYVRYIRSNKNTVCKL